MFLIMTFSVIRSIQLIDWMSKVKFLHVTGDGCSNGENCFSKFYAIEPLQDCTYTLNSVIEHIFYKKNTKRVVCIWSFQFYNKNLAYCIVHEVRHLSTKSDMIITATKDRFLIFWKISKESFSTVQIYWLFDILSHQLISDGLIHAQYRCKINAYLVHRFIGLFYASYCRLLFYFENKPT